MKRPPGYIAPRRDGIPAELVEIPHWVAWRLAERTDKGTGEITITKEPVDPATGAFARTNDPETWGTLDAAWDRYEQDGLDGVGFVLNGEENSGLDIDHCRDPKTGRVTPEAMAIVQQANSYTEVSPSGTGLRIFARGSLPPGRRKLGDYEMYETGRYLTVTGAHLDGTPTTIEDRQDELRAVHARIFGAAVEQKKSKRSGARKRAKPKQQQSKSDAGDDDKVIAGARAAKSGKRFAALFDDGNWRGQNYESQSEADLALCSFLMHAGADGACIDRIVRRSKLYRDKWDEVRSADGSTYGEMTIATTSSRHLGDEREDEDEERTYHPNNAGRRMVRLYGEDIFQCGGEWSCWDGKRWRRDEGKRLERIARDVVETYRDEYDDLAQAAEARRQQLEAEGEDPKQDAEYNRLNGRAKGCWAFYVRMSRPKGIKDIIEAASWDLGVRRSELDADPYQLNTQNGTIDLQSGELLPHRKSDLITKITPGDYIPDADSDLWHQYLDAAFGDDHALRRYVQRLLGSALVGLQTEDLIILLIGPGGSGKTTMLEASRRSIGDYGKPVPFDTFLEKKHSGGTTPELASLPGVRMITSAEPKENVGFDVARLKMLSGGDEIMVNPKYLATFTFDPVFTIVLATNFAPKASASDTALWRRVKAIRFDRVIKNPDKQLRLHLAGKITGKEADPRHQAAVLAWLVDGCRDYLANGLGEPPQSVMDSTESTRREMDPLWAFLRDECVLDADAMTLSTVLRQAFDSFANERGVPLVDSGRWGQTLKAFGGEPARVRIEGKPERVWRGIRLRSTDRSTGVPLSSGTQNRPGEGREGGNP